MSTDDESEYNEHENNDPYHQLTSSGDGYSVKHPHEKKRASLIRAQMEANKIHSPGGTRAAPYSSLTPSGDGYSVKHPEEKKRASLIKAQMQADKVLSPKETRKRRVARKKIVRKLGGGDDGVEIRDFDELRERRVRMLEKMTLTTKKEQQVKTKAVEKTVESIEAAQTKNNKPCLVASQDDTARSVETKLSYEERLQAIRELEEKKNAEIKALQEELASLKSSKGMSTSSKPIEKEIPIKEEPQTILPHFEDSPNTPNVSSKSETYFFARTQAEVALNLCLTQIPYKERINLLLITTQKILRNAKHDSTKRLLKLSNPIFWERVGMYYGGRGLLNAAGFLLEDVSSADGREALGVEWKQQPVDEMEDNLKKVGREKGVMRLDQKPCLEMVDGVLDAIDACFEFMS